MQWLFRVECDRYYSGERGRGLLKHQPGGRR